MTMRRFRSPPPAPLLALAALSAGLAGTLAAQADPDKSVAGGGSFPASWHARTDWSARTGQAPSLENVKFVAMGTGYHATMGPAALFWRDADTVSGGYRVTVAITQTKNPEHPEAYGMFFGGRHLADSAQAYTYFLVRAVDGKFSIRRRAGYAARPTAVVEWTAHDAVAKADSATGRATNELTVAVAGGTASFLVNGTEVHTVRADSIDTAGIVGYRVNHNLDVHLGPLTVRRTGAR
ncbi:MAG: hypothetical protein ACREMR_10670 [Gemmatimonadales bacterium]